MIEETLLSSLMNLGPQGVMIFLLWRLLKKEQEKDAKNDDRAFSTIIDNTKQIAEFNTMMREIKEEIKYKHNEKQDNETSRPPQ